MKGLYIHIPFCIKKCIYCDFYSLPYRTDLADQYMQAVARRLEKYPIVFDTVYFGGGTPSVFGGTRLAELLKNIQICDGAEITVECNPSTATATFFETIAVAGVNRISIGMQSAVPEELCFLTRRHTPAMVQTAVTSAKNAGIDNISVDIMLGLQGQTIQSLQQTLDFCLHLPITHISAYMLKVEPDTPLASYDLSSLPDADTVAEFYLFLYKYLQQHGFTQYEISNFSKPGYACEHNLLYWNCEPYLGIGPAAHSFWNGKRMHFPRDLKSFLQGAYPVSDGAGGGIDEYIMLRLRLTEGLRFDLLKQRGYPPLNQQFLKNCASLASQGYLILDDTGVRLTPKGFLVQNQILGRLL